MLRLFVHPITMAPHLTKSELDTITKLAAEGKTVAEIHRGIGAKRAKRGVPIPVVKVIRRAVAGSTFNRGGVETRGRKRSLSTTNVRRVNATRMRLYKDAKGEREVTWGEVLRKSRVPEVHPTTAARSLQRLGIDVKARTPREKPVRTTAHKAKRVEVCTAWQRKPVSFFCKDVDMILDNKYWPIPMSTAAKRHANMRRVRFHLRTRREGLRPGLQNGVNEGVWHRVGVGFAEVVFTSIATSLNNN